MKRIVVFALVLNAALLLFAMLGCGSGTQSEKAVNILTIKDPKKIGSMAWSPDGTKLASGGMSSVSIWDARSGIELLTLKGHEGVVKTVAWNPDGTKLASGGGLEERVRTVLGLDELERQATVRVWDVKNGSELLVLKGHTGKVETVAWSPDGSKLASNGGVDKTVRVWDASTGKTLHVLKGHEGKIGIKEFKVNYSVAWSPDGTRIVGFGGDTTAELWDANSGSQLHVFKNHEGNVETVAWSPDGSRLASGASGGDGTARVWDVMSGKQLHALKGHGNWVYGVAWSRDGTKLATCGGHIVRIWDASNGHQIHTPFNGYARSVAWVSDGTKLAGGGGWIVGVWDAMSGSTLHEFKIKAGAVWEVAWSPDGTRLASCSPEVPFRGTIEIWSIPK